MSGRKVTFHIPERHAHFEHIIQAIASSQGATPSEWVYRVVLAKLQGSGLVDKDGKIVQSVLREFLAGLPPPVRAAYQKVTG